MRGVGYSYAHHGELLQGAFTHAGRVQHGLITLPTLALSSTATYTPTQTTLRMHNPQHTKAHTAALLTLAHLGLPPTGTLHINNNIGHGLGLGSSTADVVATIRAIASHANTPLHATTIADLAIRAEGASDPVMCDCRSHVTLFGHRTGQTLRTWKHPLPPLHVVGCCCGEPIDTCTLHHRETPYTTTDIATYDHLLDRFRRALRHGDAAEIGRIATHSALMNHERLPNKNLPLLCDICHECGGVGIQIAHSGAVAGILFAPDIANTVITACQQALTQAGWPLTITDTTSMKGSA